MLQGFPIEGLALRAKDSVVCLQAVAGSFLALRACLGVKAFGCVGSANFNEPIRTYFTGLKSVGQMVKQ